MTNMKISFEAPKITVNGQAFEVLKSDAEIVEDLLRMDGELAKVRGVTKAMEAKRKAMLAYLDELLGDGAQAAITGLLQAESGGRNIGASSAAKVCEALISAAGRAYADAFRISYGEDA